MFCLLLEAGPGGLSKRMIKLPPLVCLWGVNSLPLLSSGFPGVPEQGEQETERPLPSQTSAESSLSVGKIGRHVAHKWQVSKSCLGVLWKARWRPSPWHITSSNLPGAHSWQNVPILVFLWIPYTAVSPLEWGTGKIETMVLLCYLLRSMGSCHLSGSWGCFVAVVFSWPPSLPSSQFLLKHRMGNQVCCLSSCPLGDKKSVFP
jgi:hypothetical protein